MNDVIFEKEVAMCRKLNRENNGRCHWGECESCGVIPFLYKIHKGILLETGEEIKRAKDEIFKK